VNSALLHDVSTRTTAATATPGDATWRAEAAARLAASAKRGLDRMHATTPAATATLSSGATVTPAVSGNRAATAASGGGGGGGEL
jgi:hypothetical protein